MDSSDFVAAQFASLREEIKETKGRIFQTTSFGVVVVPAANILADLYRIEVLLLALPLLVVAVALIYLAENHALMRCGRYIRLHIEPRFSDVRGWESWLEGTERHDLRSVDKYVSYSFYLLFFVYFAGSVSIAARYVLGTYGMIHCAILVGAYVAAGVWFLTYLIQHIRVSTTTAADAAASI